MKLRLLWLVLIAASVTQTVWSQMAFGPSRSANAGTPVVVGGTATVVLCPNNGQTGNGASCAPSPVLTFGAQGTSTASPALPITVNNCATGNIAACTGTGTLTMGGTPFTISGPNAADFSVSPGTCSAGAVVASGGSCQAAVTFTPSAGAGTNETATLTVSNNGATATQTMSLTGTSTTVTTLSTSSCPSTLAAGSYQLTADISCGGTAFVVNGGTLDVNLNGHTLTFGTAGQSTQVSAFQNTAFTSVPTLHGGTVTKGAGSNTFSTGTRPLSSIIGSTGSNGWQSGTFFNLTLNLNMQYANAIDFYNSGNLIVHDVVINDTAVGTCASVGCRSSLQSATIYQDGASAATANVSKVYNVTQNGGPQGAIKMDAPGAEVSYNFINPGNATGTNTQNFSIFAWGQNANVHHNLILTPLTAGSASRGIQVSDAEARGFGGRSVHDNVIGAFQLANDTEYSGCQLGGAYGVQFDDNAIGGNTAQNNTVTATAVACGATGLRVTDSELTTNVSQNSIYKGVRGAGASTCVPALWAEAQPGCAYASGFGEAGTMAFTSTGDTFTGDSGDILLAADGASGIVMQSPTFNKGSNPSAFNTFVAQNGPSSPVASFHVIDPTFNTGTSATDTNIAAQGASQGAVSLYIDWTQTVTVTDSTSGAAVAGATCTWTDTLSNTYVGTTNSSGVCAVPVTQYRNNNDSGANGHESRNPYSLAVSLAQCTTNTTTGITVSATASRSISLAGCPTVSANFNGRSGGSTIPAGYLGSGGVGSTLSNGPAITALAGISMTQTRIFVSMDVVCPAGTCGTYTALDAQITRATGAGITPLLVLVNTPSNLGSSLCTPPSNNTTWGSYAAAVEHHMNVTFPGSITDYEIWNEPDGLSTWCPSTLDETHALAAYIPLFSAASSALHTQATTDGVTIRAIGPVLASPSPHGAQWLSGALSFPVNATGIDAISFHLYIGGTPSTWTALYNASQAASGGLANVYKVVDGFVQASIPGTPILITEYNSFPGFSVSIQNDPTDAPLWNAIFVSDMLNAKLSSSSTTIPSRLNFFASTNASGYFCLLGNIDTNMDCGLPPTVYTPYPQFYLYQMLASPSYLDLQAGGHMATSVSPGTTTSGLGSTGFYTASAANRNSILIYNPTSTAYGAVTVQFQSPGITPTTGTAYLLNASNSTITSTSAPLHLNAGTYSTNVAVPAFSTVAVAIQ